MSKEQDYKVLLDKIADLLKGYKPDGAPSELGQDVPPDIKGKKRPYRPDENI